MEQSHLDTLIHWFDRYVEPFLTTDEEGKNNIQLKIEHTGKVCEAMALLCEGEHLSPGESRIASAIALLHDVGRFPQYRRWRTFRDSDSDNHARLAIDVIREERILAGSDQAEQLMIEEAIRFHNLLTPPAAVKSPTRTFINLIRDADKIDIWRVFTELLAQPPKQRASAATLGMPDRPDSVSENCVAALDSGIVVHLDTVSCVNDFIVLQISWVYDLTSSTSRKILLSRGYIPELASYLPKRDDVRRAVSKALGVLSA
ncbi:MAG: HD domain-containing protein [Desulfuromonadaceae bacterium]|nr:HD domain-containing protein [Desulfuromonadaceae bacterium]MDD5104773.1 HD domain-containing protein [Desulfuromonadaceae bacterium]